VASLEAFGTQEINRTAIAQQMLLIKCLYRDTIGVMTDYLGTDGEVLVWNHLANEWPPSWCIIRSGGALHICFSGTVNAWQWGSHIYGTFARSGFANNEVNGQWLAVWESLKPSIDPYIEGHSGPVRFSGHSYGGALAAIAALDTGAIIGANRCEVMLFGAPRYMTLGYGGNRPLSWWEVSTVGDPVPATPPDFLLIGSPASWIGSKPLRWSPDAVQWEKPRGRVWINATGRDDYDQPPPKSLAPGVELGPLKSHPLNQYYYRLRAWAQEVPTPPPLADALAAYEIARVDGGDQGVVDYLPRLIPGPDLVPVPVPWYFGYEPNSSLGGSSMPVPVPLSGGEAWTCTLLINQGIQGYSESFTFYLTGVSSVGADAVAHMENRGIALANARKKALASVAQIVGVRVGRRQRGAPSVLNTGSYYGIGPGLVSTAPAQESNAYVIRAYDATGSVRANHYFRGWAQVDFLSDPNGNGKGNILGSKVAALKTDLQNILRATHTANGVTSRGCIPTYERRDNVAIPRTVISLGLSPALHLTATLDGDESGAWAVNSYAKLSVPRSDCLTGVSGTWRVLGSTVDEDGNREVTLDRRIKCAAEALAGQIGTLRPEQEAFVAVESMVTTASTDKKCGPPFGATRGRRSAR
jgi:hypothetical protein